MDDRHFVLKMFQECLGGLREFRVIKAYITYDPKDEQRPLWIHSSVTGDPLENISTCGKAQWAFGFKKGFKGKKHKIIIIVDEEETNETQ